MTYKIRGHTPSNRTFYFDPVKKTEHNRCDGASSYSVIALFLESLITAYSYHQTWGQLHANVIDYNYNYFLKSWLQITITITFFLNVIDYNYNYFAK